MLFLDLSVKPPNYGVNPGMYYLTLHSLFLYPYKNYLLTFLC